MTVAAAPTGKGVYGSRELLFVGPFVELLENDAAFGAWVLSKTPFASEAEDARLLKDEMLARRSPGAATWWRSHFQHACDCPGCAGKETDLLAIFALRSGRTVALHVEVKNDRDHFAPGQAAAYPIRARCWVERAPARVLAHDAAATLLLCSEARVVSHGDDVQAFDAVITAEEVQAWTALKS